jgi:hypothetical protein
MVFDDRVMDVLRNDRLRSFRIDVERDSTGQGEKQSATEFMGTVGQFMDKTVQTMTQVPETAPLMAETAPLMAETLTFVVRRYRSGRTMEEQIE